MLLKISPYNAIKSTIYWKKMCKESYIIAIKVY